MRMVFDYKKGEWMAKSVETRTFSGKYGDTVLVLWADGCVSILTEENRAKHLISLTQQTLAEMDKLRGPLPGAALVGTPDFVARWEHPTGGTIETRTAHETTAPTPPSMKPNAVKTKRPKKK